MSSGSIFAMSEPATVTAGLKWGAALLTGSTALVAGLVEMVPPEKLASVTPDIKTPLSLLLIAAVTSYINRKNEKITASHANPLQVQLEGLANSFRDDEKKRDTRHDTLMLWMGRTDEKLERLNTGHGDLSKRLAKLEPKPVDTGETKRPS